jgi:excisionase family DNA binding protein
MEYISIKEAAQRLGVDPMTIRRRIKKGELTAELQPGAYGNQYMIPEDEIRKQPKEVTDVIKVTRQITVQEIACVFDTIIEKHTAPLKEEIRQLREELAEYKKSKRWWQK